MNWDALGAAGELAGAVAVVVTLIYLARQIHQQNKIARFDATQSIYDSFREITIKLGSSTELNTLFIKGDFEPDSLSDAEARQYQYFCRAYLTVMLKAYHAYRLDFIEDEDWRDLAAEFAKFLEIPGGALFRKANKSGARDFWTAIDKANDPNYVRPDYDLGRGKNSANQES